MDEKSREPAFRTELNELLSTTSHELRNSLNGVLGMLNLALLQKNLASKDEYLRIAQQAGNHIAQLLSGLQDLSSVGLDQKSHREVVEIRPFLEDLITTYRPAAAEKGLSLELILDSGLDNPLFLNTRATRQILENLFTNALKFTTTGSIVCRAGLSISDAQNTLVISVKDTGPGIRPELIDHIFQRFFRAPEARRSEIQGTGLGLAIARELARSMGGELEAKSDGKNGAEFAFWLPV